MTPHIQHGTCNNKLVLLFALLSISFVVSTLAISENGRKSNRCDNDKENNATIEEGAKNRNEEACHYRLPRNVEPFNYNLRFSPNIANKSFQGAVSISFRVTKSTSTIVLHTNKLTHTSSILRDDGNRSLKVSTKIISDKREQLHVCCETEIPEGNYTLHLMFQGRLDGIVGFYASSLKNGRTMVASKFQPTYARQAFPCFDEPDFKATYDITLVKPRSYMALSNMNEISRMPIDSELEEVTFATSVPMSTYLACFVICDFDFKEMEINSQGIGKNFKLRSFAQRDQMHKIDFAQDIGKRATEFYINYYEVPFPLPKLDMIAIPDYVSGATEHWGLITYRETSFLVDEATASAQNKINVANTIAHELAHMWFGNLVTMKWWDEVWLNEGFASYMQVKVLNAIEPSWTMLDQFLVKTLHPVLVTDAKLSSHPIVQTVATPDQITAIFDTISYNKGSSILRMLEGFIGEDNFRRGVSDYLKKHEFGNTVTQDLLSSLEPYFRKKYPELNITYIMDTWTKQMGYPLLTVTQDSPNTYQITQSRFLLDPSAVSTQNSVYNYRWFIPISYKTDKGVQENMLWFSEKTESVKIVENDVQWLKINNNQVGYYRVNYSRDLWQRLIGQLNSKSKQLSISDRANLLDDVFALAEAGVVAYKLALDLSSYLTVEEDYVPWHTAAAILSTLSDKLLNSLAHSKLQKYKQTLVVQLYNKQSWENSDQSVIQRLLRSNIFALAASSELPAAVEKVKSIFLQWLNANTKGQHFAIDTDLRSLIYFHGMKSASEAEWDKLWNIYLRDEDAQEKAKLRQALAAPHDTTILTKYLTLAWDEKNIRSQDYLNVIQAISHNPSGTALVWDDVRSRWPQLVERFTLNSRYLGSLIPSITRSFNTELKLKEMEAFFEAYPEAGAGASARQRALENVRNSIKWTRTMAPQVEAWLQKQQSDLER